MLEQSDTHSCNLYRQNSNLYRPPRKIQLRPKNSNIAFTKNFQITRDYKEKFSTKTTTSKPDQKIQEKIEVYLFSQGLGLRFAACTDAQTSSGLYYSNRCTIFFLYSNECKCETEKIWDRKRSRSSSPQCQKEICKLPARSFARSLVCSLVLRRKSESHRFL